ncbi:vanadium-dependent haloperoxidase [uncultured Pseudokineococcus sp.]|uniref:vanadium-dependent haloperoxidase n=1 Tax=uncultured Pseudokineococcus sp. TaxID=1642928 RepID=UPI00261ECC3A|nr:vanadium-dependent haloperoxidase [uncultured Pseudokineococcus sp.]
MSRRSLLRTGMGLGLAAGSAAVSAAVAAPAAAAGSGTAATASAEVAHTWMAAAYQAVLHENLTPPTAARAYAHLAVAMYEAAVVGMPRHRSLGGQLSGLPAPGGHPRHRGGTDWAVAVSAAAQQCLSDVLPLRSPLTAAVLSTTHDEVVRGRRAAGVPSSRVGASLAHGRGVATRLRSWQRSDGHAEASARPYVPPTGQPWLWESTPPNYRPAIEPFCHEVRPMVLRSTDEVAAAPHVPFSDQPGSPFHAQAMAVLEQSRANGDEERAISRSWTDNPGSWTPPLGSPTGLPSGHWMLIASQTARSRGLRLDRTLEAFVRLGVALHDAFLACWTEKYRSNLLRPITYLQRYVDPTWTSFVNTPQFPEHTSGHSVSSAAAAVVLTDLMGSFAFVDDSHAARGHPARSFTSFDDAALEAAGSRLFGGIHYPWAIEAGLDQGRRIGDLVVHRLRTRR